MILKALAMLSMLLDHVGLLYYPEVEEFRLIGRLAFPIFAFLVARGFLMSRDTSRYAFRLLALGLLSQPIYVLTINPNVLNVCFTLLLGLLACSAVRDRRYWILGLAFGLSFICEYGPAGVSLVVSLCMVLQSRYIVGFTLALWSVAFLNPPQYLPYVILAFGIIWLSHVLAIPQFRQSNPMKYGFYAFYPVHLALMMLI